MSVSVKKKVLTFLLTPLQEKKVWVLETFSCFVFVFCVSQHLEYDNSADKRVSGSDVAVPKEVTLPQKYISTRAAEKWEDTCRGCERKRVEKSTKSAQSQWKWKQIKLVKKCSETACERSGDASLVSMS